jgi:alkylation response protein AidB-like acyl-CoA dehydrogenase
VRTQFGRPLSDFQAVGQRAADAYTDVWAQELTLKSAAWRFSMGLDATKDVHLAKLWAARAGQRVVADAVHLHGGTGADRSYPLHRYFLAQTALSAQFGGAGQQLDEIGQLLADAPAGDVV